MKRLSPCFRPPPRRAREAAGVFPSQKPKEDPARLGEATKVDERPAFDKKSEGEIKSPAAELGNLHPVSTGPINKVIVNSFHLQN